MNQNNAKYEPLAFEDGDPETQSFAETTGKSSRRRLFLGVIVLQALFHIILLGVDSCNRPRPAFRPLKAPGLVYCELLRIFPHDRRIDAESMKPLCERR